MKRKDIIQGSEISELLQLELAGFSQYVLIEGRKKDLPIVITLHGGPGTPIPFSVGCRGLFPEFTDCFLMVYWDQLGCGINDRILDDSFTIGMFVDMTIDLVAEMKKRFPGNRVYFFATSWGSILCAKALEKCPGVVDGAVVNGQIIRNVFFNDLVMDTLEQAGIPEKKMEIIRNASPEQMQTIAGCLRKYTDAYQNKKGKKANVGSIVWGLLTSPDYSLKDFKAIVVNGYLKNRSLWKEILGLNLTEALSAARVPYWILQGDTDLVTPTPYVQELVAESGNSNLRCRIIPNTGHMPGAEMMDAVFDALKEISQ